MLKIIGNSAMNRHLFVIAFAISSFSLCSCTADDNEQASYPDDYATGVNIYKPIVSWPLSDSQVSSAIHLNDFSISMTRTLWNSYKSRNESFVASPLSIAIALAMVAEGADDETLEEIINVLGFGDIGLDRMSDILASVLSGINEESDSLTLCIANACYVNHSFGLYQEYVECMNQAFSADVAMLDFSNPNTVASKVNNWCKQKTNGNIDSILGADDIDNNTLVIWLNAIHMRGKWYWPFKKELSHTMDFIRVNGNAVPLTMMKSDISVPYLNSTHFAAVRLPYCSKRLDMTVILPYDAASLDNLLAQLSQEYINNIDEAMKETEVSIFLPRFSTSFYADDSVKAALQEMGICRAFDISKAQINKLSPSSNAYISLIRQKAEIQVCEDGTEASAVTVIKGDKTSVDSHARIDFMANHSFIYLITDRQTGLLLFTGVYDGD